MVGPRRHGILHHMKGNRSARYRREHRNVAVVPNDTAPDECRLATDAIKRALPLRDPCASTDFRCDRKVHGTVLVDEPEQLLERAQRTPNHGSGCLVKLHDRSPPSCMRSRWKAMTT